MPEVPASVKSSQVAERTMFCVMTVARAHRPVKPAMMPKTMSCASNMDRPVYSFFWVAP